MRLTPNIQTMHGFNLKKATISPAGTPMTRPTRSTGLVKETGTHLGRNLSVRSVTRSMHVVLVLTNAGAAARKVTDLRVAGKNSHLLLQAIRETGPSLERGSSQGIESPPHTIPRMRNPRNPDVLAHWMTAEAAHLMQVNQLIWCNQGREKDAGAKEWGKGIPHRASWTVPQW